MVLMLVLVISVVLVKVVVLLLISLTVLVPKEALVTVRDTIIKFILYIHGFLARYRL